MFFLLNTKEWYNYCGDHCLLLDDSQFFLDILKKYISLLNNSDVEQIVKYTNELKGLFNHVSKKNFICIDGNIASGKSTMIQKNLHQHKVIVEPVDLWRKIIVEKSDGNLTDAFSYFYEIIYKKGIFIFIG